MYICAVLFGPFIVHYLDAAVQIFLMLKVMGPSTAQANEDCY